MPLCHKVRLYSLCWSMNRTKLYNVCDRALWHAALFGVFWEINKQKNLPRLRHPFESIKPEHAISFPFNVREWLRPPICWRLTLNSEMILPALIQSLRCLLHGFQREPCHHAAPCAIQRSLVTCLRVCYILTLSSSTRNYLYWLTHMISNVSASHFNLN